MSRTHRMSHIYKLFPSTYYANNKSIKQYEDVSRFRSTSFRVEITPVERRQLPAPLSPSLPSPACLSAPAARSPLSASKCHKKHEMATWTAQPGARIGARPTRGDHTRPGTAVCKSRWSTYKSRARRKKMSPVTSSGSVLVSPTIHSELEISARASAARGAKRLLESRPAES